MKSLAAFLVSLLFVGWAAVPAQAATGGLWDNPTSYGTVYVQSQLHNTSWNRELVTATRTIDGFTGSAERNHACRSGNRCITVKFGSAPGSALGRTTCHAGNCTIVLERGTAGRYRLTLILHELGHAFGLSHNPRCTSVMYPYRTCWTKPLSFIASERAILRRN